MKKIAIVGGGIGGITASLYLRRLGYEVTLYEKSDRLGGRLTYELSGDFEIDQGPTIVLLPELLKDIFNDVGFEEDQYELISIDPVYDIHFKDGTTFRKYRDQEKTKAEIEAKFPGDGDGFERYLKEMEDVYYFGVDAFLSRDFQSKRDFLSLTNLKFVLKSKSYRTVTDYLSRYFKDQRLRDAYSLQTLYIGGAPHQVPALYGLISYSEHAFGVWYVKGGYYSLIPKLEAYLHELGVTIKKQTPVEKIIVENNQIKGLISSDGPEFYDKVVYNGDYPTIEGLIDGHKVLDRPLKPSSGCVMVYLGLSKQYTSQLTHQFFMSHDFSRYMESVTSKQTLPTDPSLYVFNPTAVEDTNSKGSTLYILIPVPIAINPTEEELHAFVDDQLRWLEETAYEDLTKYIEWKKIRTPRDAERDGLYLGGSFGVSPLLSQSGAFRPQIVYPTIKGLYAVGASVHPGGGVPIVMQGAKLLKEAIERGE